MEEAALDWEQAGCLPARKAGTGGGWPVSPPECRARDERFSLIFTLASFTINFMTFPTGYIFDRFKTTVARLIAM